VIVNSRNHHWQLTEGENAFGNSSIYYVSLATLAEIDNDARGCGKLSPIKDDEPRLVRYPWPLAELSSSSRGLKQSYIDRSIVPIVFLKVRASQDQYLVNGRLLLVFLPLPIQIAACFATLDCRLMLDCP